MGTMVAPPVWVDAYHETHLRDILANAHRGKVVPMACNVFACPPHMHLPKDRKRRDREKWRN